MAQYAPDAASSVMQNLEVEGSELLHEMVEQVPAIEYLMERASQAAESAPQ
jgi:hypothetical protein